jgi:dehydrogenase/reductase SDR family protein 12
MTGKTFVITGANSGIGYAAAKKMATLNATVYLVCRSEERGKKAVKTIS